MEYPTWIYKEREHHFDGRFYLGLSKRRIEDRIYLYEKLGIENLQIIDEIVSYFKDKYAISKWHGLSKAQRRQIFIDNKATCCHCGKSLTRHDFTVERIIPFKLGGSNDEDNLRISCDPCNQDYIESLGPLIKKILNDKEKEKTTEKNNV